MMKKWFIIIYPDRCDECWNNISSLCRNPVPLSNGNDSYSVPFPCSGFTLFFYQTKAEVNQGNLEYFFNENKINNTDEIIIFGHEYGGSDHPGITTDTLNNIKKSYSKLEYRLFSTGEPEGYPCKILYCLNNSLVNLQQLNLDNLDNLDTLKTLLSSQKCKFDWDTLKEEVKKKDVIEPFSLLKHRIANLFLPLDMNLQVIYEISKQSKEKAVEHLKEVLENKNKNPTFYRQKLADLQFMVAKVQTNNENPKLNCDTEPSKDELVKPKIKEDNLPDNNSILDLIPKDKKEKVKEEWENLLKLSGIGLKENNSDIFDKNSLEPKFNSPIFLFMRLLDCKIVKYSNKPDQITINDVDEILNFEPLKKLLEEIGFHLFSLNPFSHWYNFLNSYLDKLREKIVKEEEK